MTRFDGVKRIVESGWYPPMVDLRWLVGEVDKLNHSLEECIRQRDEVRKKQEYLQETTRHAFKTVARYRAWNKHLHERNDQLVKEINRLKTTAQHLEKQVDALLDAREADHLELEVLRDHIPQVLNEETRTPEEPKPLRWWERLFKNRGQEATHEVARLAAENAALRGELLVVKEERGRWWRQAMEYAARLTAEADKPKEESQK